MTILMTAHRQFRGSPSAWDDFQHSIPPEEQGSWFARGSSASLPPTMPRRVNVGSRGSMPSARLAERPTAYWHDRASLSAANPDVAMRSRVAAGPEGLLHAGHVFLMRLSTSTALLLAAGLLGGCTLANKGTAGDCNTRIGFQGIVYRPHNALNQAAPPGKSLGKGDLLDCDGSTIGHERVSAVKGVDAAVAVLVKATGHGIYVAEGVPRSAWPAPLRQP